MKQVIIWLLAGAAWPCIASAQVESSSYTPSASEIIFNTPPPGQLGTSLIISLPEGNKVWLELTRLDQVEKLPNLDSVLSVVRSTLFSITDTLKSDVNARRVNIDLTSLPIRFQVITHRPSAASYAKIDGNLAQLKIDQDTIRIRYLADEAAFITLLLNNLQDLYAMPPGQGAAITRAIDTLYQQHARGSKKHSEQFNFSGNYDMATGKNNLKNKYDLQSKSTDYLQLIANPGIGYARGSILPGLTIGASVNFTKKYNKTASTLSFGAFWEPQFSFAKNDDGKTVSYRHDFLTVRFQEIPKTTPKGFSILNHMAVGYLLNNKGNTFENNTFKLTAPGIQNGRLHVLPEFYFNDFFKNFSPGIRMVVSLSQ